MRKKINISIAVFMCLLVFFILWANKEESEINIIMERIDKSIIGNTGEVVAEIYYDKPVLTGNMHVVNKINSFFEEESQGWLGGKNRLTHFQDGWLSRFLDITNESRKSIGDTELAKQPFLFTVDTEIVLHSDNLLSIFQIATYQTAGPGSWYYYGSTFDLETGELLPVDAIIEISANGYKDMILSFLEKKIMELELYQSFDELEAIYGNNNDFDIITSDNKKVSLNYDYYYDGKYIYIILNYGIFNEAGGILRWNAKLGDDFNGSLIGYVLERDKSLREIEY